MKKKGGPANGTPLKEWSINDDGLGMLTGTLKVFLDGSGSTGKASGGVGGSGALGGATSGGNAGSITGLFNQYSGNNGLSNPKPSASGGGLGAGIPKTGDAHPYDGRLRCFGVSVNRTSLDYGYAEAQYVGLLNDPAGVEWEITANTEDSPIETHPDFLGQSGFYVDDAGKPTGEIGAKFGTITKEGINPQTKGPYWNLKNVSIDGPSQSFKGFRASDEIIKKNLVGVESYKTPLATYRVSYTTANQGNFEWALKNLGCYFNTLPSFIDGGNSAKLTNSVAQSGTPAASIPAPSTKTPMQQALSGKKKETAKAFPLNLLLTSVSVSQASGLYKVSVEFMRGGPKGWNTTIYAQADESSWSGGGESSAVKNK